MFLLWALLLCCRLTRCQCHSDVGPVMFGCSPYIGWDVSECKCVCVWARFACVRITSSFIKSAFGVCFVFPLCFDSLLIKKQLKQRQKKIKQNRAVEMEMEIRYTHILNQFISILFRTSTAQVVLRVSDPSDWMVSWELCSSVASAFTVVFVCDEIRNS